MTVIITLLVLALLFFFLEIFVPGGFLAIIGILCIIGAAGATTADYGWMSGLLVFIGGGVFVVFMFFVEVKWLLRTPFAKRIQHNEQNLGASLEKINVDSLVGTEAEAATRMTPSGRIRVEGQLVNAKSENGWVHRGEAVIITGSDVFHVFVRKKITTN